MENVRWLSGFTGSSGAVLVTADELLLFTDSRYAIQAGLEAPGARIHISGDALIDQACEYIAEKHGLATIGFESDSVTYQDYRRLRALLHGRKLRGLVGSVQSLRVIKDAGEIAALKRAAAITDAAFAEILTFIRPGLSEREIARKLVYILGELGAERESFPCIVAAGERAALPHAVPSDKSVKAGELLLLDFGGMVDGYAADITRTVYVGIPGKKFQKIYAVVLEAQLAALEAIRPGVSGRDVDAAARRVISTKGYGANFGHGLGHMLGLNVHDGPAFSPRSTVTLKKGMVTTVEPGIYIEGWGGVRIEDDIVVTKDGCEILTHSSKDMMALPAK